MTGFGVALIVTVSAEWTRTVVSVVARSFVLLLSNVSLLTRASSCSVPVVRGSMVACTVITEEVAPGLSEPSEQVVGCVASPGSPAAQVAPGIETEVICTPGGTALESTTLRAVDGPLFVVLEVQVRAVPATPLPKTDSLMARSASAVTVRFTVAVLLVLSGSGVLLRTVAWLSMFWPSVAVIVYDRVTRPTCDAVAAGSVPAAHEMRWPPVTAVTEQEVIAGEVLTLVMATVPSDRTVSSMVTARAYDGPWLST